MTHPRNDLSFEELQKIWYSKLKEEGFEDIEDTRSSKRFLKTWHSTYFQARYHPDIFAIKQEYYRRASLFLNEYEFSSAIEREIFEGHAEGLSLREIAKHFEAQGIQLNKDKIHKILKPLIEAIKGSAWRGTD